jgi:hypothetical protein
MKKIFTFVALVAMAMVANAQASYDLNNPIGQDGRYIVKWDCAKGQFAESNNFEPGETFTFAVDITGTGWLDKIQEGGPNGSTRAMAANIWTNYGPKKDATNRLKQIQGNIYGATYNFQQMLEDKDPTLTGKIAALDTIVYTWCQLFIFAYTETDNGVEWYVDAQQVQAPASDCFFATIPSTGKSDPEFYTDDYDEGMYGISEKGYAAPCASAASGVENTEIKAKSAKFIEDGQLYIISNGVKYNALGAEVK